MELAAVFKDNMVLQRDKTICIFGKCNVGDEINIKLGEDSVKVRAKTHHFKAYLPPRGKATGLELYVTNGLDTITRKNIAVGEVWLAGGQSNMELAIEAAKDGEKYTALAEKSDIRYYNVPRTEYKNDAFYKAEKESEWTFHSAEKAKAWSAVAFHFAKMLEDELDLTIGIIGCNLGGTSASCWVDRETLTSDPVTNLYVEDYDKKVGDKTPEEQIKDYEDYKIYYDGWNKRLGEFYGKNPKGSWEDALKYAGENRWPGPMGLANPYRLSGLYDIMLSRVAPIALRGVIYYQGEEDSSVCERYDAVFNMLISAWRRYFEDENLPFICVSLPMFAYTDAPDDKKWAVIREVQQNAPKKNKNVYTAIALDCGELDNIHPTDKLPVGQRLARLALEKVYGIDKQADAPEFDSFSQNGDTVTVSFKNTYGGLHLSSGDKPLGFEISSDGENYEPAEAQISGDCVLIKSEKKVLGIRYQWTNYGEVNLYGENGIPVAAFKSR